MGNLIEVSTPGNQVHLLEPHIITEFMMSRINIQKFQRCFKFLLPRLLPQYETVGKGDDVQLEPLLHEPDDSVSYLIALIPVSVIDLQLLP